MKYYSLKDLKYVVDFKDAVLQGQAPGQGLFFPAEIPQLSKDFLSSWKNLSKEQIAFDVIRPFVGDTIDESALYKIVSETVAFEFPLVQITEDIFTLELFHGPTAAFKDVGARFMSRCLRHFAQHSGKTTTILVATSGDTGGAVADAFHGVEGVEVVILFPSGRVSKLQELQLTTYGGNIRALEIDGTFDDCQGMVKRAFSDEDLSKNYHFSSANSINVARWLSQQFYYFYALQHWHDERMPVISVPSGNFGNICAGLVAAKSGLPIGPFIAACNENDVFTTFVQTGAYRPRAAVQTVSNAMDVGNPSNFERVLRVFDDQASWLKEKLYSYSYTSEETVAAMAEVYRDYQYLMDPHGAVGFLALRNHMAQNQGTCGIFLETAHPAKFADIAETVTGQPITIPAASQNLWKKESKSVRLSNDYEDLKGYLLS